MGPPPFRVSETGTATWTSVCETYASHSDFQSTSPDSRRRILREHPNTDSRTNTDCWHIRLHLRKRRQQNSQDRRIRNKSPGTQDCTGLLAYLL